MKDFQQFIQTLALKGSELKKGVNNPLSPKNDKLLSAYLYRNHTDDAGISTANYDIFWKWLCQDQYELDWVEDKIPAGVAKKKGITVKPRGKMPVYKDPAESVREKEALELQYKTWQACIKIANSTHANHSIINRRRQKEIIALIDSYKSEPTKAEECLGKIRKLQASWAG